ncbi:MAG: hypothetical protein ACTSVY_10970 [Candidatus Helarchaeota archaeon]
MSFEIRPLQFDYDVLKTYANGIRRKIIETGLEDQEGPPFGMSYTRYNFILSEREPDLALGAYNGEKLIGTIMGITYDIIINDPKQEIEGLKLRAAFIGNLGVGEDHWYGDEIREKLMGAIVKKLTEKGIDLIITTPLQDKEPKEIEYLKSIGFKMANKNIEAHVKFLGRHSIDHLKDAQGLNPIEAGGAKLLAGWKSEGIQEGVIRDLTESDYPRIIELLNDYTKELTLSVLWDEDLLKALISRMKTMDDLELVEVHKKFPDSLYGTHFKVWEINGKIQAHAFLIVVEVHLPHGYIPLIFLDSTSFSRELTVEQKRDFITAVLKQFEYKAIVTDCTTPYFDKKALSKAGFTPDHRTRRFMIKILSEKARPVEKINKIKKFSLNTLNFTI